MAIASPVPHNIEAEEALLGSVLIDPSALDDITLKPEEFYIGKHRLIYQAMRDIYQQGQPVDVILLCNRLEQAGHLQVVGGMSYLSGLVNTVPSALHAVHYAELVRETARKRALLALASELAKAAYADKLDGQLTTLSARLTEILPPPPSPAPEPSRPALSPLPAALQTELEAISAVPPAWLTDYVKFAETVSPMSPRAFHETSGLWLISTMIARRMVINLSFETVYPNLWVLWNAKSSIFKKTTALRVAQSMARAVAPHLLAADETTPEALVSGMSGGEPSNLMQLRIDDQNAWQERRNYAAQRGWLVDEFSGFLAASARDYNTGLIEMLLKFYNCEDIYRRETSGKGLQTVHNAYLTILTATTPTALAPYMLTERLWGIGWWPRFIIITPEEKKPAYQDADTEIPVPTALTNELLDIYQRLPSARWPDPPAALPVVLQPGAFKLWKRYSKAMTYDLLDETVDEMLWPAYARLHMHALKTAMLLAALEWRAGNPIIHVEQMAIGIRMAETWRASLHRAYEEATMTASNQLQVKIMQVITRNPQGVTMRDICKTVGRKHQPTDVERSLQQLIIGGEVLAVDYSNPKGGQKTIVYTLNRS